MKLFCVIVTTILGTYMMIRSLLRICRRGDRNENIMDDPSLCEGAVVDFLMLVLGVFLLVLFAVLLLG